MIFVKAITGDGEPHPEISEEVEFEMPDNFTKEKPTCTCWIGDTEGDGKILRHTFCDDVLRPYLEKVSYGNIIIEIR